MKNAKGKAGEKCFACGRKLGLLPKLVTTRDDQTVYVGQECYRRVMASGRKGYQPPRGGPKLWTFSNATPPRQGAA